MILNNKLKVYIKKYSSKESNNLKKIRIQTYEKFKKANMMSDFIQGRLLSMISKMVRPKTILEIGTFTGYSTICLSEGLKKNGRIFTIEKNQKLYNFYHKNINLYKPTNQIHFLYGDATKIIPNINKSFDLIFIDADKKNYSLYLDMIKPKLKHYGFILVDNVLWLGRVINNNNKLDKFTKYLIEFNKKVKKDDDLETIILPIRDGISLIRKK